MTAMYDVIFMYNDLLPKEKIFPTDTAAKDLRTSALSLDIAASTGRRDSTVTAETLALLARTPD